ncbi:Protein CBR-SEC-3 [Caenorhabditis briggsae]|uniref:Protein CBR-SEC-3 n=1 Tax=Caenorhabditis briggsae TaxID=6238 RepID=A8XJD6_CAEBR|nr:Protein CBR-SEC-3 [Caenorhabditis briggsae]CAP32761.2 Protein CBR-SEC-3 [Caenorhabditis briggsae]
MSAIRKIIQRQLFQKDDERIQAIVNVNKLDGKKKKNQTLLCLAVTIEHPIAVRLYFVKGEKDDTFKKKDRFNLREVREIDGINPKKPSPEFHITIGDRQYVILAGSANEKDDFIRELYKLSCQYLPVQMPDFCNFSLPQLEAEASIIPIELPEHDIAMASDYQPVSAKEDADFRKLIERANLTIGDAHAFAEMLTEQLQSLDGANINSMMDSENSVNQLLSSIDAALTGVESVEKELDNCDDILAFVRNSIELIEEKDSLSVVERKNKARLNEEIISFVNSLQEVTDAHIETLKQANFSNPESVQKCTDAARAVAHFWHGRFAKPMLQMKAYQDRNDELAAIDVFVDRLMSHLSALFSNLNDLSLDHEWHELCIPKQSQRFRALSPLSDLINWLKTNRPKACNLVLQKYIDSTNLLYKRLFDNFFDTLISKVPKAIGSEKKSSELAINQSAFIYHFPETSDSANTSLRSDNQSFMSTSSEIDTEVLPQLIETVLAELSAVIDAEQKFVVRFFHINSELLAQFDTTSTGSGDSSSLGGRSMEKHMNEQVRHVMGNLFDSLNIHLDSFCRAVCRHNPSNVLLLFVIMSKKVLLPQDPSSYFLITFGSLVVLIKRQFDAFIQMECGQYSEVRIVKKTRIGILPSIARFAGFVRRAETIFENAERRTDLEKAYFNLCRAVCDGIQKAAANPYSKSPSSVVKFENYHELYLTLSELKISCLDQQRKDAKALKEEHIDAYVKEFMGRPLKEIQTFFDNVNNFIEMRGIRPEEISYQQQFSRMELKKVISQHPGKEVKKGLEQLYKKIEKNLVANSSLLQVVWRDMQEQFIKQIAEYNKLILTCYPGIKIELEVSTDNVLQFFSEIAQQH